VLPAPPDVALHRIRGSRRKLERDRCAAIVLRGIGTKTHPRRPGKRNPDDALEVRRIAVPSDWRAGTILSDQRVDERCLRLSAPRCDSIAQRHEEIGEWAPRICLFGVGAIACRILSLAITDHAPARRVLLKERLVEWQFGEYREERFLLFTRDELGTIDEARRQRVRDIEEIGLCGLSHEESAAQSGPRM